jgi:hypothetical protein
VAENSTEPKSKTEVENKTQLDGKEVMDLLLDRVARELEKDDFKMSVADMIRLMQWREEAGGEKPREIEVRWVEERNEEKPE